jgi:hypothetical protein
MLAELSDFAEHLFFQLAVGAPIDGRNTWSRSAAKLVLLQLADAAGHDCHDGERRTEENLASWGGREP